MTGREDGARPAADRPGTQPTVTEVRAAARILARRYRPDWRPATDGELDAFGAGYGLGVRDNAAQDRQNRVDYGNGAAVILDGAPIPEWPPVTPPGGGA